MNTRLSGRSPLLALVLCCGLAWPLAGSAQIYKWVDENGVTHFSERPPHNTPATLIKPKTGHSEPVFYGTASSVSSEAAAPVAPEEEVVSQEEYHEERCRVALRNMDTLRNFGRVKVQGVDGEIRYLDEEEQRERLVSTQEIIDESC